MTVALQNANVASINSVGPGTSGESTELGAARTFDDSFEQAFDSPEALKAFFRDLLEFLREFSSVEPERRLPNVSPRRVHRAAVRPDSAGKAALLAAPWATPRLQRPLVPATRNSLASAAPAPVRAPAPAAPVPVRTPAPAAGVPRSPALISVAPAPDGLSSPDRPSLARRTPGAVARTIALGTSSNGDPVRVPPFVAKL